ncbi:MAG: TIGR04211 family SH3 domain-containing protein [Gammaproteobacteria bacterium]
MKQYFFMFTGLLLASTAWSETAYVTDMLQLNMYATQDQTGAAIKRLRSGDQVEIVARDGRIAEVKIDGQKGWVKSLYLVDEEPARTRINQLERQNEGLDTTVKKLRSQLAAEKGKFTSLQEEQSGSEEQRLTVAQELEQLRSENNRLEGKLDSYGMSVPFSWLLIAALIALVAGLAGGWYWVDHRSRMAHGGYRIY